MKNMESRYNAFIQGLTQLSRQHGIALQAIGGVICAETAGEFADIEYVSDISSGDLIPKFIEEA